MSVIGDRSSATWLDQAQYPFLSKFVQVDGGRMHYVDEGKGEPIIFVHGFPTWSFMWRKLIKDLSDNHRCIAMDHIGFGLSDKPDHWSYTPEAHAKNFRKLLEHLGVNTYSLVVHDFGGPIALAHSLDFPGRLNRLAVLNSFMWSLKGDDHFVKFDHKVNGAMGKLAMTATSVGLSTMLHGMVEQKQKIVGNIFGQYTGPFAKTSDRLGALGLAKGFIGSSQWLYDLWVRRDAIANKPVQVLWGMKDKLFTSTQLDKWRSFLPNAECVTFPESGHLVIEEQLKEVEAALYLFLAGSSELESTARVASSEY